jgi:phage tail sheath protein FI
MPTPFTSPGVYVQEVPSGIRAISGVPTSVAAFVGRALRGPVEECTVVTGYGEYERTFGGLWKESTLGFAVRDFFANGGGTAVIVRLYAPDGSPPRAVGSHSGLALTSADEGAFGASIRFRVDHDTRPPDAAAGESETSLFTLTVFDGTTGVVETHRDVAAGPVDHPRFVTTVLETESTLVRVSGAVPPERPAAHAAPGAGQDIWALASLSTPLVGGSDGAALDEGTFVGKGRAAQHTGLYALDHTDIVNLLVIPPYDLAGGVGDAVHRAAARYATARRAMYLIDGAVGWTTAADAVAGAGSAFTIDQDATANVALSFPRLRQPDPLDDDRLGDFATAGAVAGVIARTDARRGVWKAPAGLEATVRGVSALEIALTDDDLGQLTRAGVNALRPVPRAGVVIWGARTLQGADRLASEWKYVPVRRTALFIEESILHGTRWAVFEPNDEPLWAQLRFTVGAFLHDLFRQGAFQGTKPSHAYFVRCDSSTMTQADIDAGIVRIEIGFAPLKPAEFVVIRIRQVAARTAP